MTKKHDRDVFGEPFDSPPVWAARAPLLHPGTGWKWAWAYIASTLLGAIGLPLVAVVDVATHPSPGGDGSPLVWAIIIPVLFVAGGLAGVILVLWAQTLVIIIGRGRGGPDR